MDETLRVLSQARDEILELRRQNELLRARVSTLDLLADLLHGGRPSQPMGMSEDVVWRIELLLATLTPEPEEPSDA